MTNDCNIRLIAIDEAKKLDCANYIDVPFLFAWLAWFLVVSLPAIALAAP
jgi:hypothetical protein